jgi:diacylglycerol kinase family enzyme
MLCCRAERVFEREVLPVLQDAAGMRVESLVTCGPGAATNIMSQLNVSAVDLVVFVGGDGTVYEGLQVSGDWRVA